MWNLRTCWSVLFALFIGGCSGAVIQTIDSDTILPEPFDGAFVSYAFAKGMVNITASYSTDDGLRITSDTVKSLSDFNHVHKLAYSHAGLSTDTVDIKLDSNGLLASVSSTTSDQTLQTLQALNALLTQVGTVKTTFAKSGVAKANVTTDQPPPLELSKCTNKPSVVLLIDVTNNTWTQSPAVRLANPCSIELKVNSIHLIGTLEIKGYPTDVADRPNVNFCDQAICFRRTAAYQISVTAKVTDATGKTVMVTKDQPASANGTIEVLAPARDAIGFVRFNRRAFVENTTTIEFTNGMLSRFYAKDPSQIAGILSVQSELLKSVVLTVPLVK